VRHYIVYSSMDYILNYNNRMYVCVYYRPDYFSFWFGASKIGGKCALLNTNVTGEALMHSIEIATAGSRTRVLVADGELRPQVEQDRALFEKHNITVCFWDDVAEAISAQSVARPSRSMRSGVTMTDTFVFIYTSGTTGMPKAAKINHYRVICMAVPMANLARLRVGVRVYNCLPLYHTAGGMMCLGGALNTGATIVLRKKFSVKQFSSDCVKYNCTVFQYIGELCRYLCNSPIGPDEDKMKLTYAFGNGLRPDVWEKFKARFHVEHIVEFYGATEGTLALYNTTGRVGALGYIPPFADSLHPARLLVVSDECRDEPVRDASGRCVRCRPGQVGLFVSPFPKSKVLKWEGYSDKAASEKKILRNVFVEGDSYFNSGDLLSKDAEGLFYWSDRVGDTFRWRGENVSTAEVELAVMSPAAVAAAVVYGVCVAGCDGRAGMAAVVLAPGATSLAMLSDLVGVCSSLLPAYARPCFVRIIADVATTGTFKFQKGDLMKEGFDPILVGSDELYFCSWKKDPTFVAVDDALYARLVAGEVPL
jgi:fatty-acyl-CoA synthase